MHEYPFQRRLGAFPLRNGRTEFRVWAPRAERRRAARRRRRPRARDAGYGIFEATRRRRGRRATTSTSLDGERAARSLLALAAAGPARARRGVFDPRAFEWTDGELPQPPACTTASSTSCTSARSRPRAPSTARSRTCRGLAELGVTAIELMPVAEFPGRARLGLRRRLPERRPVLLRRPARRSRSSSTPPTRVGLAVMLDVVYNHVGASGHQGAAGLRAVLHRQARDAVGRRPQRRRRALRRRPRVGVPERRAVGARLPPRRPAPGRDPRDRRLEPRAPRGRDRPPRARRRSPGALVIAESGLNDPKVMRVAELGGHGCDAAWADDFHHALRTLLTGDTDGLVRGVRLARAAGQGLQAPARPRRHLLDVPQAALRGARGRRAARALRRLLRRPRPGRQPRARRPPAGRDAARSRRSARSCHPSRPCCSRARSTASGRRSSSSPTTSTPRSPTRPARAAGASSPSFAEFSGEEVPDPQDAATFERSKLTRERRARRAARPARASCCAPRRELPPAMSTTSTFDERAGWLAVRRGEYTLLANFARDARARPARAHRGGRARHRTSRRSSPASSSSPPLSGALVR